MSPKRHQLLILGCIQSLVPATGAIAQAELTPDGGPVTVAESADDESVLFANNSAAAIDQDGNVGIAYTVRNAGDQQRIDIFSPNGELARHTVPMLPFEAFSTPTVSAVAGNIFVLGRYAGSSSESVDLIVNGFHATGLAADRRKTAKESEINPTFEKVLTEVAQERGIDCSALKINAGDVREEEENFANVLSPGLTSRNLQTFTITCDDSKKLQATIVFFGTGSTEEAIHEVKVKEISPPHSHQTKTHGIPPARAPLSATARSQDATIMAYLAQPLSGPEYGKITVAELDDELEVASLSQIDAPLPKPFPGSSIATCGYADLAHYWVAWPTDQGRVAAARFEGDSMEVFDLGGTLGAVDLACDGWGNAVVSWAQPGQMGGPTVHTEALGPEGETLAHHEEALSPGAFPDLDAVKVSNDVNEAGDIVVAWSDGGDDVVFRRLKLSGHFRVDGTLAGSFFSPAFDGEGFIFDVVELDGTPTMVIYYFTYNDDGSGEPTWLVGSAPIEDNRVVADMITGSGATFGAGFDPEDVERKQAGTVTATFLSCRLVLMEADSNRLGQQAYLAGPLTGLPLSVSGQCGAGPEGTTQVDASRGGSLFNPSRDGEGFIFDVVNVGGEPTLVAYYFTYQPDGSGDPAWMVGTGPIEGDSATVTMTIGQGATFGPDFDPADVERTEWGEIQVTWQTCKDVLVEYDGLWGEGSFNVGPLTPPLIGASGLCAP